MQSIINKLFNLSLTDRLYILERAMNISDQKLMADQIELDIEEIVMKSQVFLENGSIETNVIYRSKFK